MAREIMSSICQAVLGILFNSYNSLRPMFALLRTTQGGSHRHSVRLRMFYGIDLGIPYTFTQSRTTSSLHKCPRQT